MASNVVDAGEMPVGENKVMEISAERFAQLFHHYHQALSDTEKSCCRTSDAWAEVPQPEKGRMIAAARLALLEVEVRPEDRQLKDRPPKDCPHRRYFAKPGEAEWGC
jgi:hypothetical protein